jgi:hypothetical protein
MLEYFLKVGLPPLGLLFNKFIFELVLIDKEVTFL